MPTTYKPYPSIAINGTAFKKKQDVTWYEHEVIGVLDRINQVTTGQEVLKYIHGIAGRALVIKPYLWDHIVEAFGKDAAKNLWNATAEPVDSEKAEDAGQSVLLEALLGRSTHGSPVEVYFTKWVIESRTYRKRAHIADGAAGSTADEVLLHELVHAAAQMLGRDDSTETGDKMRNVSEFRSILVANIYATDPSNPSPHRPVRRDHKGAKTFTGTTGDLEEDFLNVGAYRNHTRDFIARLPGLAVRLAAIPATFNPVRRFLKDAFGVK